MLSIGVVGLLAIGVAIMTSETERDSLAETVPSNPTTTVHPVEKPTSTVVLPSVLVTTTSTSIPAPEHNPNEVCGIDDELDFIASILQTHGVVSPHLLNDSHPPMYRRGEVTVEIRSCESKSAMAHELGHYVMDLAHHFQLEAHLDDVITNFCPGGASNGRCQSGWIKGDERFPGLEHAAHCIGNVLIGTTKYTQCPNETMRALAATRVAQAAGVTH